MIHESFKMPKVKVAVGLYSHLDSVIKVDNNVLKWIENSNAIKGSLILNSIEEVIYSLKNSIKNGDSESLISKEVYEKLCSLFPQRELRTGGNGNNAGRALFELGIVPLVSYPTRFEKLMKISPNFKIAVGNIIKTPTKAIRKNDPEYDHIIFESEKWRNIFSWDLMSSQGIFDDDFLKIAFDPKLIDVAIISYAHLILPKYKKRTDYVLDFIKSKRPKIHLEFGMGCEESMKYAMKKFAENEACDSWGLDERECRIYLKVDSEDKDDLIEASLKAVKDYNLKRICIHSSKFAFSISKFDVKKEIEALSSAHLFTALKTSDKIGLRGKVIKKKLEKYNFCLVPSFFNPKPKKITGLGDSFAAIQAVKTLF
jgi:ADP-dependent phosphofructokinase/glucokinase